MKTPERVHARPGHRARPRIDSTEGGHLVDRPQHQRAAGLQDRHGHLVPAVGHRVQALPLVQVLPIGHDAVRARLPAVIQLVPAVPARAVVPHLRQPGPDPLRRRRKGGGHGRGIGGIGDENSGQSWWWSAARFEIKFRVFCLVELRGLVFCLVELRGLETLTPCLQSTAKMSSTVCGLGRGAPTGPSEYGNVQARWCRLWVSSRPLLTTFGSVARFQPSRIVRDRRISLLVWSADGDLVQVYSGGSGTVSNP
jgi:hypothetical protein